MSRRRVDALDPKHTVVVGYDSPLNYYFADVFDRSGDKNALPIELFPDGTRDISAVESALAPFCETAAISAAARLIERDCLEQLCHDNDLLVWNRLEERVTTGQLIPFIMAESGREFTHWVGQAVGRGTVRLIARDDLDAGIRVGANGGDIVAFSRVHGKPHATIVERDLGAEVGGRG